MRCVASLRGEAPPRLLLLPAGRRRRRPAPAQARHAPARGGHRDARAGARRSEMDPHRRRARRPDEGVGAPGALPRAEGAKAGGGAARARGRRPDGAPGGTPVPPLPRPRRERGLGADRRPGGDPPHPPALDRRRPHHLAAAVGASDRRRGQGGHGGQVDSRPPRLAARARAPAGGQPGRRAEGEVARRGRAARREARGCGRRRLGADRGGDARPRARGTCSDDPQRLRLRGLPGARLHAL